MDLALTDLEEVKCHTVPKIADHKGLVVVLPLSVPKVEIQSRLVWRFRAADWEGLKDALSQVHWAQLLDVDADEGARRLTAIVLSLAAFFIPRMFLREQKATHPWISDKVLRFVQQKRETEGTERELECRRRCSEIIVEEFGKYVSK